MPTRSAISNPGGDDVHGGLHGGPADELDALEQRAHVVDGEHRVLATEPDVGERPPGAVLSAACEDTLDRCAVARPPKRRSPPEGLVGR